MKIEDKDYSINQDDFYRVLWEQSPCRWCTIHVCDRTHLWCCMY